MSVAAVPAPVPAPAGVAGAAGAVVAIQCALLSRAGGGLPAAVLPVAGRLAPFRARLVAVEGPEAAPPVPLALVRRAPLPVLPTSRAALAGARLVHTHGLWTGLSAGALAHARRTGAALVVSPHGMLDPWALALSGRRKRLALALVERRHLERAVVHALTPAELAAVRALGIAAPVAVIPNGVDLPPAGAAPPPAPAWLDRPTLLFLGRLHAKKGVAELIAAWGRAAPRLPDWQLAIAGWDDGPNAFRAAAARGGGRIVFPGPLFGAAKAAALAHAAAFVLPSFSEGLPMSVLEAWAHARPVLMTDACHLPEGFAAGAAARIATDPAALADVLAARLPDEGWRAAAGAAGRRLVAARFTWDRVAAEFRALYAYALEGGPRPGTVHG